MEQKKEERLLSVIVPVYNVAPYLRKCIDSILCQTYQNLEILLVSDGVSTDGSTEICDEYAAKDERIKVLHQPRGGLVAARKAGVAAASGEYIAYVDGDDWIDQDAYESLMASMGNSSPDVLIYNFQEEHRDRTYLYSCVIPARYYEAEGLNEIYLHLLGLRYTDQVEIMPEASLQDNIETGEHFRRVRTFEIPPSVWSKLIKRELLKKTQAMVPDIVTDGEDRVCTAYTLLSAKSVMVTENAPYHYRIRDDSMSRSIASFRVYRIMFDAMCSALQNSPMMEVHMTQLYIQMTEPVLLLCYELFLSEKYSDILFGNLKDCRVALYGAGRFGREIYQKTRAIFPDRISLWVDQNFHAYQAANMPVKPVETLQEQECDVVIIALLNESVCKEIKQNLIDLGIDPGKIRYVHSASQRLLKAVKEIIEDTSAEIVQ